MNTNDKEATTFHTVQPHRDLESNWAVDLAHNLEEYLLKICSGEITGGEDDGHLSVNFAEAALLLQGSIQVYSRKVEYLYSLVLHALEFISQKSQQHDQPENSSPQEEQTGSLVAPAQSNDSFWGLDDIPVDAKNSLDTSNCSDAPLNCFVKPPANLVVLEGDCLDASGDSGELESYLLATNDLYKDFILLDTCDAVVVDEFLGNDGSYSKNENGFERGSSLGSKSRKSFLSPSRRSGGTGHKLSAGKNHEPDHNQSAYVDQHFENNDCNINIAHEFKMDEGFSQPEVFDDSDEDDEDPWKPLNPHERGNLKVKPFKKVKASRMDWSNSTTPTSITEEFPLAKLDGPVSAELHDIWEAKRRVYEKDQEPQSLPYYEKLRQSLVLGDHDNTHGMFSNNKDDEDDGHDTEAPDFEPADFDMPDNAYMNEDRFDSEKNMDDGTQFDVYEDPNSHANLEELCRSHLDSLLSSIAETEKQTALATRVSNWKQRIEQNLDEQDSRPPFDIHEYGQLTLDKLSLESEVGKSLSFADVVRGQEKHEVARTFSALLQLVNNGNVEIDKGGCEGEFVCYTVDKPFHVRLLNNDKRGDVQLRSSNKRPKSDTKKEKENRSPPVKLVKGTPQGKRRRRSRLVHPNGLT